MRDPESWNLFFNELNQAVFLFTSRTFGGGPIGGLSLHRGLPTVDQVKDESSAESEDILEFVFDFIKDGPCIVDVFVVRTPKAARIYIARGEASSAFEFRVDGVRYPPE